VGLSSCPIFESTERISIKFKIEGEFSSASYSSNVDFLNGTWNTTRSIDINDLRLLLQRYLSIWLRVKEVYKIKKRFRNKNE
jgi:hypothetical protein